MRIAFRRLGRAVSCSRGRIGRRECRAVSTGGETCCACVCAGACGGPGRLLGERDRAESGPPAPAPDLSQPNYRRIVADNIKTIFPKPDPLGELEISGVRLVDHLKGPAWLTCLKLDAHGKPQHYAIFIQGDKIIDCRAGIVIDQCHKDYVHAVRDLPPGDPKPKAA